MPEPEWPEVLDALERELESGGSGQWHPPAGLGPLPAGLAPRARALLAAQQRAIEATESAKDTIAEELSALRRPPAARVSDPPAYIDTVA